jgi:hypothetical protein
MRYPGDISRERSTPSALDLFGSLRNVPVHPTPKLTWFYCFDLIELI